jgi:hypothetical protein
VLATVSMRRTVLLVALVSTLIAPSVVQAARLRPASERRAQPADARWAEPLNEQIPPLEFVEAPDDPLATEHSAPPEKTRSTRQVRPNAAESSKRLVW